MFTVKRKKTTAYLLLTVVLVLGIFFFATPVSANYVYNGIHWDSDYVYYDMSALPAGWQYSIMYAAAEWNSAGADFLFAGMTGSGNTLITGTGPSWWPAYCNVYYDGQTLHISTCHMIFNTYYFDFYTDGSDVDVQTIATHEFGHWLNLGDSDDDDEVMYGEYQGVHRDLDAQDIAGIIAIYGT